MGSELKDCIVKLIRQAFCVDAIYLYGSRARGTERPDSDWDIAVLFREYTKDHVEGVIRPQNIEAVLERELKLYGKISVVDAERVPVALQYNIIKGHRWFDENNPHVKRFENSVISKIEKDGYERT